MLTIAWVIKEGKKWDAAVALDNLNTLSCLVLKRLGYINKVAFYTIDYVPNRFENKMLNNIYHCIDKLAVGNADITWNLTDRMAEGREKVRGLKLSIYNRQVTLPIGIWFDRYQQKDYSEIKGNTLIYAGGLAKHQGIQLVIEALPLIREKIPDIQFKIIGKGEYESDLRKLIQKLHLEDHVSFLGYFEDHKAVERIIASSTLAMAMYSKEFSKWSYYADPSKMKTYLAAGVPVVTTELTYMASELVKNKCGIVIDYNKEELAKNIIAILNDIPKYKQLKKNAVEYAKNLDWKIIFGKGFSYLLKNDKKN